MSARSDYPFLTDLLRPQPQYAVGWRASVEEALDRIDALEAALAEAQATILTLMDAKSPEDIDRALGVEITDADVDEMRAHFAKERARVARLVDIAEKAEALVGDGSAVMYDAGWTVHRNWAALVAAVGSPEGKP